MDKTIKQIADEYKLSKQAVRKRINQLPTSCYYVGANHTIYVTDKGLEILASQLSTKASTNTTNVGINVDTTIDTLIKQLEIKDKQIESLQKLLDQEQQLHAMAQQKLQLLEDKASEEAQKKRWWFSFR